MGDRCRGPGPITIPRQPSKPHACSWTRNSSGAFDTILVKRLRIAPLTDKRKSDASFHGLGSLKRSGRAGRKPQLGTAELRRIKRALKRGPEALGYESGRWTSGQVALLIERECGVRYHPAHAWRIVRDLIRSLQKPTGRARERDEGAIRRGKQKRWPDIEKSPPKKAESSPGMKLKRQAS